MRYVVSNMISWSKNPFRRTQPHISKKVSSLLTSKTIAHRFSTQPLRKVVRPQDGVTSLVKEFTALQINGIPQKVEKNSSGNNLQEWGKISTQFLMNCLRCNTLSEQNIPILHMLCTIQKEVEILSEIVYLVESLKKNRTFFITSFRLHFSITLSLPDKTSSSISSLNEQREEIYENFQRQLASTQGFLFQAHSESPQRFKEASEKQKKLFLEIVDEIEQLAKFTTELEVIAQKHFSPVLQGSDKFTEKQNLQTEKGNTPKYLSCLLTHVKGLQESHSSLLHALNNQIKSALS